jgi:hypothetical protein
MVRGGCLPHFLSLASSSEEQHNCGFYSKIYDPIADFYKNPFINNTKLVD